MAIALVYATASENLSYFVLIDRLFPLESGNSSTELTQHLGII